MKTLISIASTKGGRLFVTAVKWADGPGFAVKAIKYSADRKLAHGFSRGAAEAVAQHLAAGFVAVQLHRPDGEEQSVPMSAQQSAERAGAEAAARALTADVRAVLMPHLRASGAFR